MNYQPSDADRAERLRRYAGRLLELADRHLESGDKEALRSSLAELIPYITGLLMECITPAKT